MSESEMNEQKSQLQHVTSDYEPIRTILGESYQDPSQYPMEGTTDSSRSTRRTTYSQNSSRPQTTMPLESQTTLQKMTDTMRDHPVLFWTAVTGAAALGYYLGKKRASAQTDQHTSSSLDMGTTALAG